MTAVRFINEGVKIPSAICWMWARKTSQGITKANIRLRKLSVKRSGAAGRESKNFSLPNLITNQIVNSGFIKVENQITLQGQMMFLPYPKDDIAEGDDAEAKKTPKSRARRQIQLSPSSCFAPFLQKKKEKKKVKPRKM